MTHEHDHSHSHDHSHGHGHSHSHSHDHGQAHSHSHPHSHSHSHTDSGEMSFEQKLEKLFAHWIDHNESHKDTFSTWAQRSDEQGLDQVAGKIKKVAQLSEQVTQELTAALELLKK